MENSTNPVTTRLRCRSLTNRSFAPKRGPAGTANTFPLRFFRDNRTFDKEISTNQRHQFRPPRATGSKRPQHLHRLIKVWDALPESVKEAVAATIKTTETTCE
jgi:hypothetical protein